MIIKLFSKLKKYLTSPNPKNLQRAFENVLIQAHESPSYFEYTQKVHRLTFKVFNLMDLSQFNLLKDILIKEKESHFLDIGCGFGIATQALANKTNKDGFGFDFSHKAIEIANTIKEGHYFIGDFNKLKIDLPQTNLFISIDGLYAVRDYHHLFSWMNDISLGEGKLIVLKTETGKHSEFFNYLKKNELKYTMTDITNLEVDYWKKASKHLPNYKDKMMAEGNELLAMTLDKEMTRHLEFIKQGELKRFLIEVQW